MKKKSLLLILLMTLLAPWAVNAQGLCDPTDMCEISYTLTDAYGDGWDSGASLEVIDVATSTTLASWHLNSGSSSSGTLSVCNGRSIQFVWVPATGSYVYNYECGFTVFAPNGDEICSDAAGSPEPTAGVVATYTVACPSCPQPTNLKSTLTPGNGAIATLSWTENGTATDWMLEYGTASDFTGATPMTTGFTVSGTTVTANLTGLTAEQTYYARVKADCGGGDESDWSATCEFKPTNSFFVLICDGTATSTNAPIKSGSGSQSEFVYPASMLTSLEGKITSVKFYASTTSASYTNNVTVYVEEVSGTTESTSAWLYNQSTATKVYEGTTLAVADGEMEITFSTPFNYNGGNLCFNIWAETSAPSVTWKGEDPGYASCGYDYYITPPVSNPYGTAQFLPKVSIYYSPEAFQKPKNLTVSNLTNEGATISWTAPNTNVTGYKYQYKPDGGTWTTLTSTTALSAPLTGLTGNTTYTFQVQAIYAGNNESAFASTSFTTPCDAFSIDPTAYQYGFEDLDDMDCWTLTNVTNGGVGSNTWAYNNLGYEPARTGTNFWAFLYVDYDDTDPEYQTLISPELTDIPANGVHVEFYYVKDLGGSGAESFRVGYSTTDKNLSSFIWGAEITDASTTYQRFSANYPQGTKYVAVQHTSDDQYYLFLDDFTFEGAADCLEPSSVLADNITTTSADITWTAGGEETAWDIYVTDDSTIVPDDGTTPTYANVSTKPYPLSLNPATTYYVYVRAACKGTETSAWSTPGIFHTECEGMDLPYGPYGFEDGALSVCWNVINTNTSYNSVSVSESNPNTGTHSLAFFRGSATGDLVAVLPEVGAYDLNDYQFEFSAKGSYAGYEITIGIMTDAEDLTTFVAQGDVITTTTSYAEHKVRFNEYTGTGKYVAIKVVRPSTVTYGSIYVDDIAINPIPSCIEPTGLAVTAPTPHGATFSWTAGGSETEWHLYFGKDATAPADDIPLGKVTVADSNPFTLTTGLDAETEYYVWVRANCGGTDGNSIWVGPKTFTTGIACPAPTGLAYSEVTNHTAKLSWTGTSDSYNVWYRTAATMSNPIFSETFETSSLPTGWDRSNTALTDDVLNGTTTINSYSGGWYNSSYGLGQYNWKMNIYNTGKYWLITPSVTLDAKNTLNFDAAITAYNSNNAPSSSNMANANSRFVVLITTDDQATWTILREWNNTGSADVLNNISNTGNNFSIDLTSYAGETVKIAFYGGQTASGPDCDLHIDNVVIGTPVPAGAWTTKTADASPYVATGLLAETKYEAMVQGVCTGEGTSQWTAPMFFTTEIACPAPSGLTATNPTSSSFDIQWTNGGAEDWIVAYKKTTDSDFTEISLNESDVTIEGDLRTYTLGGLDAETEYTVKVRDNCEASVAGDGYSEWTAEVSYSTIAACSALNPVVSDITHHNATVNFEGESTTGFNVYYRTAAGINASFSEAFDASTLPTGWDKSNTPLTDDVLDGTTTIATGYQYGWSTTSYGLGQYNMKMNIYSTNKFWLITPSITIGTNNILNFDAAITKYNGDIAPTTTNMADANSRFVVLITTDDMATWTILREWNNTGSADVLNNISNTGNNFTIDLSSYKEETVKIAFYGHQGSSGPDCDLHIDNVMVGVATTPGAWETEAATGTTANLTGLTAGTKYDVKVVPNCDETLESATVQFTTISDNVKHFLTAGNWNDAANWLDEEMPSIDDEAVLFANANIFGDASAKKITFSGSPTPVLTIENGGTLQTNNTVTATVKKHITGYGAGNEENKANYYLIAHPFTSYISYTSTNFTNSGLITGNFDLYSWSYTATDNLEWRNYEASNFSLSTQTGYLYAHETDTDLAFTGTVAANNTEPTKSLNFATSGTYDFNGWNLVGNPFTCNAFITLNAGDGNPAMAYYRMNSTGTAIEASTDAIKPMEGIFVKATAASQTVKFSRTAPATDFGNGQLNINVAQVVNSRDAIAETDNAIIRFDGGNTLEKFVFREGRAKLYIPQDETEYAVVASDGQGMMPLNFKVEKTGNYTVSFSSNNVEFSYLHLIDNLTGEDIDLLIEPSYTFMASVRDRENRFIVKFNTIDSNIDSTSDIFAYQNGDEIIVSGEGELQVYDIMGRFVMSSRVNGTERFNASSLSNAVYIFRLVGNEVKTQKIVVK